jgi:putative MATE family efflux protein
MLRLAMPVLLEQILAMLVGFADTWLTGRFLLPEHLAAIGLIAYLLWLIPCLFGAVAIGATALIARFIGAGNQAMAVKVTHQSLIVGAVLAAAVTIFFAVFGGAFVRLLQLPEEAARLATLYLMVLTPIIPAMMAEQVGIACLRGAGDTLTGFIAMSIVNVVNIALSASLVTGWGPFPNLGWAGLAIGTATGYAVAGVLILAVLIRGRAGLRLRWSGMRPDRDLIRRILRIGVPGGVDMTAIVLCHLWFVTIVNSLGVLEAAAHGLAIRIESLAYLPGTAFQVAAATMTGQSLGAGDDRRATRSILASCLAGGALMSAAGVLFFFGGEWLTSFFLGPGAADTQALAAPLLKIVAISQPSLALAMVLSGAFRGAGDTRWPLAITFIGYLGIRVPLAYLLAWEQVPLPVVGAAISGYGLGVVGAWYAMVADVILRSLLILTRFLQGGWKRVRV